MNKVKPTPKQRVAMQKILEGSTPTQAMIDAGYSEETSSAPTRNLLSSNGAMTIVAEYKDEYAKVGITPKYMAKKTAEWLEAQKQIGARVIVRKGSPTSQADGELPLANSQTDDFIEVPDYQTQLKAAEMVRKDWKMGEDDDFQEEATFTWRKK